jgi:hypothetical protein
MGAYLTLSHVKCPRLGEIAFGLLVTKAIEKGDDFAGIDTLAVSNLEGTSEYPGRLFLPLASKAPVDSSGELEIVGDERCGQVEKKNTDQAQNR